MINSNRLKSISSIFILVIICFFIYNSRNDFLLVLTKIEFIQLLKLTVLQIVLITLIGLPFRILFQIYDINITRKDWIGLSFICNLTNYLLPFKPGLLVRYVYLQRKYSINLAQFGVVTVLYTCLTLFSAVMIIMITIPFLPSLQDKINITNIIVFITIIALIFISSYTLLRLFFNKNNGSNMKTKYKWLSKWVEAYCNIFKYPLNILSGYFVFVVINFVAFLTYYFAFESLSVNIDPLFLLFIVSFTTISSWITLTPGNIGVTESLVGFLFKLASGDFASGFLATTFVRLSHMIVSVIFGCIASYFLLGHILPNESMRKQYIKKNK